MDLPESPHKEDAASTPEAILEMLRRVKYPGFNRDIVSFGLVKEVRIRDGGVRVTLLSSPRSEETLRRIREDVTQVLGESGFPEATFVIEDPPRAVLGSMRSKEGIQDVHRIVAVASGKGGVGKSTVATNLALALKGFGRTVGLLDADVHGPSVPTMLGLRERPRADSGGRPQPVVRDGLSVLSVGLIVPRAEATAWRGAMITKVLNTFLRSTNWGKLDYLVIDLPPGTGDVQLTICQQLVLAGAVIVTTPQATAVLDARRAVTMFRDVNAPILGLVENMSGFSCRTCGHAADIFGTGGGHELARSLGVPLLGVLPLAPDIRESGDAGRAIVEADPTGRTALAGTFASIARNVEGELARIEAGRETSREPPPPDRAAQRMDLVD